MTYAKIVDGTVAETISQAELRKRIRKEWPLRHPAKGEHFRVPDEWADQYVVLADSARPVAGEGKRVVELEPEKTRGTWKRKYALEDIPAEELAAQKDALRSSMSATVQQVKLALLERGDLDTVREALAALKGKQKDRFAIMLEAGQIGRTSKLAKAIQNALSYSEDDMDALFTEATKEGE